MKLDLVQTQEKQQTIQKRVVFKGFSLFSGEKNSMVCDPGTENSGINFYYKGVCIPALAEYVEPMDVHTTALSKDGATIMMVEHLLSAIWGLGIDNLKITLDNPVVPAQEGSAEPFVQAFLKAKIIKQTKSRKVIVFTNQITITQPEFVNRYAKFEPHDSLLIESSAPFPFPIGEHTIIYKDIPSSFTDDICWARTFLRSPLDLKNLTKWNGIRSVFKALPIDPRESPIITFTEKEFLTPLKKIDEPARHKLLDFIGDLALVGYRIHAKITINEPGHKFTHQIAQNIRQLI